jgi:hypothetical protein
MPARKSRRSSTASAKVEQRSDAILLLRADHRHVQEMFKEFERAHTERSKREIASEICEELKVHTQIEEELLYPAARRVLKTDDMVDEAEVEHASARALIEEIEQMQPSEHLFDAKVKVLGEYIDHHIKEEHRQMFPKLRASELDLRELGEQMEERKAELLGEGGPDAPAWNRGAGLGTHGAARH